MAQNSKATPKPLQRLLQNSKLLKIKHFVKFFGVLEFTPKTALPSPTHPLPHPYPISSFFLYIPLSLQTLQNKKQKTKQIIGRVGLDSFGVALEFLALLLKTYDNKAPPTPPLAQHRNKTVENQALHDAN
jgi:hypothetical protein